MMPRLLRMPGLSLHNSICRACMQAAECWAVAFGDACGDEQRCLLAGYADGDLRLYDLRTNSLRWQVCVHGTGVGHQQSKSEYPAYGCPCKVLSALSACWGGQPWGLCARAGQGAEGRMQRAL